MKVSIDYFDPANGQAMNLQERIAELFKTDSSIQVTELGKTYTEGDITSLEMDVTSHFGGKIYSTTTINRDDYADVQSFRNTLNSAFNAFIPPVKVIFSSKGQIDEAAEYEVSLRNDVAPKSRSERYMGKKVAAKHQRIGLAVNLYPGEIKALEKDLYPIECTLNNISQYQQFCYDLSGVYFPSVVEVIRKAEEKTVKKKWINRYGWALGLAALALFFSVKAVITVNHTHNSDGNNISKYSNSKWDGVWEGYSWRIELNSRTGKAIIDDSEYLWEDGGNYAVISAPGKSVLYLREDGRLFTGDNRGNITVDFGFKLTKQ